MALVFNVEYRSIWLVIRVLWWSRQLDHEFNWFLYIVTVCIWKFTFTFRFSLNYVSAIGYKPTDVLSVKKKLAYALHTDPFHSINGVKRILRRQILAYNWCTTTPQPTSLLGKKHIIKKRKWTQGAHAHQSTAHQNRGEATFFFFIKFSLLRAVAANMSYTFNDFDRIPIVIFDFFFGVDQNELAPHFISLLITVATAMFISRANYA